MEILEERVKRNDDMASQSVKYNITKNDEYFQSGGKTAKYKETEDGYFVFDGYED